MFWLNLVLGVHLATTKCNGSFIYVRTLWLCAAISWIIRTNMKRWGFYIKYLFAIWKQMHILNDIGCMWTMWEKKMGHTASERSVLGSKSNFSPGASLWFCTWSSLSSVSFSKPSTTAILLPPRYLQKQETHARRWPLSDRGSIRQHEQTGLLTAWRASADEWGSLYEWCCCSVGTDGWGWRQNPGCKCAWFGCHKGKGQQGSCTRRYHPETHEI